MLNPYISLFVIMALAACTINSTESEAASSESSSSSSLLYSSSIHTSSAISSSSTASVSASSEHIIIVSSSTFSSTQSISSSQISSSSHSYSLSSSISSTTSRILNVDYEQGDLNNGLPELGIAYDSSTLYPPSLVDTHYRTGSHSIRYELHDEDAMVFSGVRAESDALNYLPATFREGDSLFYGMSIYIPPYWQSDSVYEDILYQWKLTGAGPHAFLGIKRSEFILRYNYGAPTTPTKKQVLVQKFTHNDTVGEWYDFVLNFKWSTVNTNNGSIAIWIKSPKDSSYTQAVNLSNENNMYTHNSGSTNYVKWGLYCPKWSIDPATGLHRKTYVSKRVIYFDNVRIAESFEGADPAIE